MPTIYLRREPTEDGLLLAQERFNGVKIKFPKHSDVVAYRDRAASKFKARWPWSYARPRFMCKRVIINCCSWTVIWLQDKRRD